MLTRLVFTLFIIVLRQNVLGTLLGCKFCHELKIYTYIITAESIPDNFLDKCSFLMSQQSCSINLEIDLNKQQTIINVTSSTKYVETSITASVAIENGLQHKRYVSFWCSNPHGGCNDKYYLQRVLQSVTIDGSFKELEPLLVPTNQTIDNSSCLVFSNTTTSECQSGCSDNNKGCYIDSLTNANKSSEVCADCSSINEYHLIHSMTFFVNNLSISQSDNRLLSCAVPQCNSIANLERIHKLVTINFDAKIFFDTSTTTITSPTTTSSMSSSSTYWINAWRKYWTLFILLMILFV